jgi:hypothetical protein
MDDALSALTDGDRAILLLRYQEGCDYRTIGEILDLPAGTVASRLSRARDQLRALLRKGYGPAEEESPSVHQSLRRAVLAQGPTRPARGEIADCQS